MKIIDDKGRLFGLINVLDLSILIILGISAFIFYTAAIRLHTLPYDRDKIFKIQVLYSGIPLEIANAIKIGDLDPGSARITDIEKADIKPLLSPKQVLELYKGPEGNILDRRIVSQMVITYRVKGYIKGNTVFGQNQRALKLGVAFLFSARLYDIQGVVISIRDAAFKAPSINNS